VSNRQRKQAASEACDVEVWYWIANCVHISSLNHGYDIWAELSLCFQYVVGFAPFVLGNAHRIRSRLLSYQESAFCIIFISPHLWNSPASAEVDLLILRVWINRLSASKSQQLGCYVLSWILTVLIWVPSKESTGHVA
jgi:hypothetical protein